MFERTRNLQLSPIKQIELRAACYTNVISLAQGIPSFDTPNCIKKRAENALKRGVVAKYSLSPGLPELRELIELSLAKENIYYDWRQEIIVTAGSIEAITAGLLTITVPGDEVIIPNPTYASYQEIIKLAGCQPIFCPLNENDNWSFNLESLSNKISSKTKAIIIANPNNPTGTVFSREQLIKLGDLAITHNFIIITDEVYKDFIFGQNVFFSLAEMPKYRQNLIRVFSFSKAYAMTGWRVGYLASDQAIISEILKIHDALVTCAPVISQYAAMGALEMGDDEIVKFKKIYQKRKQLICQLLDQQKDFFTYSEPQGAYFVFPRFLKPNLSSWDLCLDLIEKIQVALVHGSAFGPNGEAHLRFNFGRSEKDITEAMARMKIYFQKNS